MNNPYYVLGVRQDATKKEIMDAQLDAMKVKRYPLPEIHSAMRQLLDPARRLAADFMYPTKIKSKRPQKISFDDFDFSTKNLDINEINDDSFDSLDKRE